MGRHLDKLQDYLRQQDWKNADLETKWALLEAAGKDSGYITVDEIREIHVDKLSKIDELWSNADYRFGFRKQYSLLNQDNYDNFVKKVGWRTNGIWKNYDDLFTGNLGEGSLPYLGKFFWERYLYEPVTSTSSHTSLQSHKPHYHYHQPHRPGGHGGEAGAGLAALGTLATAAAPWLIVGAAAVGGYMLYRNLTKEEREKREKAEQENQIKDRIVSTLEQVDLLDKFYLVNRGSISITFSLRRLSGDYWTDDLSPGYSCKYKNNNGIRINTEGSQSVEYTLKPWKEIQN